MSKLDGKVAVVTGASKGIGAEIARQLAANGAAVVVNYASSKEGAEKVVNEIKAQGGKAVAIKADVSKLSDIQALFAAVKKEFGRVDILINNAGVYELSPIKDISEEQMQKLFGVNVFGLVLTTQEAIKHIGTEGGSIVNISSVVSTMAPPNFSLYAATKGAVDSLTRSLAKELASRNIRVNSINPGLIETEGVANSEMRTSGYDKIAVANTPLGRIGQPQDIAPTAVFLASNDSAYITGESIFISGGRR